MPKAQAFVDELSLSSSPRIYRKGYLFREVKEDTNGKISGFDDVKTLNKAIFDHDKFAIYSDIHFTDWDHSYGSTHNQQTTLPNADDYFDEAWLRTIPSGGVATTTLMNGGVSSSDNGTFLISCTNSQTVSFHKTNIIKDITTTTGSFTLEWAIKKGGSESGNANAFTVRIKLGQFQVEAIYNLTTVTFKEVGVAGTDITAGVATSDETGQYTIIRIIIDMQRASAKATCLIGDAIVHTINHTTNNGATSDNEVRFGYLSSPTTTSQTFINYIRYHNASFFPLDVPNKHIYPSQATISTPYGGFTSGTPTSNTAIAGSSNDERLFTVQVGNTPNAVLRDSSLTLSNTRGTSYEMKASIGGASSTIGKLDFTMEDGTISNTLSLYSIGNTTLNDGIKFNGTTVAGYNASVFHTYRIVCKGTGAASAINSYLYIDGELATSQSNTTSTANSRFDVTFANTNGAGTATYNVSFIKLFNKPAFNTRIVNRAYLAFLTNAVTEGTTLYVGSDVVLNDLDDILAAPVLESAEVFQKDLSWGDTGFDELPELEYRGDNSTFTNTLTSSTPAWTSVTVPDGSYKRDAFTKHRFAYFQIRMAFDTYTQELTFMKFHRQLDVSDYVTSWGQSNFERDFISRKINGGDLRIRLMNPDDDFESLRRRPDLWIDAKWETWIGATTDMGDYEYPDFIGSVDNIIFESNTPFIICEISNLVKTLKEISLNAGFKYPPFSRIKTFAGEVCYGISTRKDTTNDDLYWVDSKYDLNDIDDFNVYIDGILESPSLYAFNGKAPAKIDFITAPSGTVTIDFKPMFPFNSSNSSLIIQRIIQKDGGLLLNETIDKDSFDTFETDINSISLNNIEIEQTKLFDFLENISIQSSASLYINPETQTSIAISLVSKAQTDYQIISDRNISEDFHHCEYIHSSNPIENCLNTVDFTFNTSSIESNFTYVNRRTIEEYDSGSPIGTSTLLDVFGIKSPSSRITNNPTTFFNILTSYDFITSSTDLNIVIDRNFALFGYRPPIYDLYGLATNIFTYSFRDVLVIMRDSTTIPDDSIQITRIQKDYDNLSGTIQGLSNRFYQYGSSITLRMAHGVPDTICENFPTLDPCTVTTRTLNPSNPNTANSYWVACDDGSDADASFATLSGL